MLEQTGNALTAWFVFLDSSGDGVAGLTVKVNVRARTGAIFGGFVQDATELDATDYPGVYYYTLSGTLTGTPDSYIFYAKRTAGGAVAQNYIPALWVVGAAWVQNVNAAVSTRLPTSSYTTPPSTAAIAGAILVTAANKLATAADGSVMTGSGTITTMTGDVRGKVLGGGASSFSGVGVQADVEQWRGAQPNVLLSGRVDTDIRAVNGVTVGGVGTAGNPWGPA